MRFSIKLLYLYLFSFIGLLISVIGSIQIIDLGIKVYVFKGADKYSIPITTKIDPTGREVSLSDKEKEEQMKIQDMETNRQRKVQLSNSLAMLLVGLPLYKYHWGLIKKEDKDETQTS
jgi:hypothetical protein